MVKVSFASGIYGEFGLNGGLPWGAPLKGDMEQFKKFTEDCILVMGHKTFESLPTKLRGLRHAVITTDLFVTTKDGKRADLWIRPEVTPQEAINSIQSHAPSKDLCIIGGAKLIEDFIPYADEILHTSVYQGIDPFEARLPFDKEIDLIKIFLFTGFNKYTAPIAHGQERCYGFHTRIYTKEQS